MADYKGSPCPPGFFCLAGDEPRLCPAGTMRDTPGASSSQKCPLCRDGYYCPNDTKNTQVRVFSRKQIFNILYFTKYLYHYYFKKLSNKLECYKKYHYTK